MSSSTKLLDPAFQGAGQRVGTEIWRIENFQPVPLPASDYGKFYSGDSYIVLQTTSGRGGAYLYDIHFWIGKDTSQDEAGTAAIKTVELDAVLGGRAVQHREIQGHESDKFLSFFKPCIIPLEGGVASGFKKPEEEKFEVRLYVCRGKRIVRLKQVPFARSSLNHDDVFILDTENKIYQFNGSNSNIQERAKALEVIQYLKEKYHEGKSDIAIIDDGKLQADSDSGEFWVLFGGFAPISKKTVREDDPILEITPATLYSFNDGQLKLEEGTLSKEMLENNKYYLLDCGAELFVWVGRLTQVEDRKAASKATEEFLVNQNRPKATRVTQVIQGFETQSFKSKFESWPVGTVTGNSGNSGGESGKGIVAALLKQQGADVKGATKYSPGNEDVPPLLEKGGKIEVWRINGSAKTPVPKEDIGKFYSGDSYIVLYTYHSGDKKDEYFLSCWIGKDSVQEDQKMAIRLANTMWNSLKGRPVQGRIFQGKETPQFIALFQPMVVLKGGVSSGYKKFVAENNLTDETYTSDSIALIRLSGTSAHNDKAVQVDAVAASLSSTDCFLLQTGNSMFIWHGSSTSLEQQQWAVTVAEFLKPGVALKLAKEGTESSSFWFALGGKQTFNTEKVPQEAIRDPHLYTFSFNNGKLEISEVFNFSQDDLLTEDMLILDTHAEVFIWVGQSVDSKEKQKAFEIGEKYIKLAASLDSLSPDVALYKVMEGNEPCFFTTYFSWDISKATAQGNSFQKKLSSLFGTMFRASKSSGKSNTTNNDGPTQRASALAALSSAFNPSSAPKPTTPEPSRPAGGSQRAAAVAALSTALTAEQKQEQSETSLPRVSRSSTHDPAIDGPTQRESALAALSSAFNPSSAPKPTTPEPSRPRGGSQRQAAFAALSSVLTAEQKEPQSETSVTRASRSSSPDPASPDGENAENSASEAWVPSPKKERTDIDLTEDNGVESEAIDDVEEGDSGSDGTFSYERLRAKSSHPIKGIDYKRRETYLSDAEFQKVLRMTKEVFYQQPRWKQDMQKRKVDLF